MKISDIETYTVSAEWKNWLFVKVRTDTELYGIAEATINGFIKTTEAAIHELKHFAIGRDPREITAIAHRVIGSIQDRVFLPMQTVGIKPNAQRRILSRPQKMS